MIPDFVPDRVVEHERLALIPGPGVRADPDAAFLGGFGNAQREKQPQHPFEGAAMRGHMLVRTEDREKGRFHSRDALEKLHVSGQRRQFLNAFRPKP